jgi:Spy/CpxP family protein refolding chaperone
MKSTLLITALSLCLTAPLWAQSDDSSDSSSTPPAGHHHWHGGFGGLTQDERTELKTAHDKALQDNPDLATEEKQMHQQMCDYMKKMHDAMVKADPNVEPIFAKMKSGHHHHGAPPADDSSDQ